MSPTHVLKQLWKLYDKLRRIQDRNYAIIFVYVALALLCGRYVGFLLDNGIIFISIRLRDWS